MEKYDTYIVWRVWWLFEQNGTYGAIFELLDGLYVWIKVRETVFVLVPIFWNDFRFLFSRVFYDG